MNEPLLRSGATLPNGATVLLARDLPHRPGHYPGAIVLAYEPGGKEFVTWLYVDGSYDGRKPYCDTGQYRREFVDALYDYFERLGEPRPVLVPQAKLDELQTWAAAAIEAGAVNV